MYIGKRAKNYIYICHNRLGLSFSSYGDMFLSTYNLQIWLTLWDICLLLVYDMLTIYNAMPFVKWYQYANVSVRNITSYLINRKILVILCVRNNKTVVKDYIYIANEMVTICVILFNTLAKQFSRY